MKTSYITITLILSLLMLQSCSYQLTHETDTHGKRYLVRAYKDPDRQDEYWNEAFLNFVIIEAINTQNI